MKEIVRVEKKGNSSNNADYEEFELKVTYSDGSVDTIAYRWKSDGETWSELNENKYDSSESLQGCSDEEIAEIEKYDKIMKKEEDCLYEIADKFIENKNKIVIRDDQPEEGDSQHTIYSWHYAWK